MQRLRTRLRASASRGAPAALSLDFLSASGALDPRITFSRGSNATLTDSTGRLTYAPSNLATNSEAFDNAAWTKAVGGTGVATTVTANAGVAPDGTTTADQIVFNRGAGNTIADRSYVFQSPTVATGVSYISSIYLKAATAGDVGKQLSLRGVAGGGYTLVTLTNAWQRVSSVEVAGSTLGNIEIANRGTVTADNTVTALVWGAQLSPVTYQTTPGTYNSTTPKNLIGFTQEFDNVAWTKTNAFVQTNLLTYSQDFDNASWTKQEVTVTANATTAPDGTLTADKLTPSTVTSTHQVAKLSVVSSQTCTISFYAKADGYNTVEVLDGTSAVNGALFNISAGSVSNIGTGLGTITAVGNGWYRCILVVTTTGVRFYIPTSASNFTGNGTSGIFIWGAQLVQGSVAGDYQRTDAAAAAVQYYAPDGSLTADKLVASTSGSARGVYTTYTASGSPNTGSVYVKAGEKSIVAIADFPGAVGAAWFNLATGVVSNVVAGYTASIQSAGNGWYRCSVTGTPPSGTRYFQVAITDTAGSLNVTANGTDGIYIWGAQLSDSASLDPYVYNPAAAAASTAYYGPRFDYDPLTLAPKGLLIEEARTNNLLYSDQFDNAAWTDAAPTSTVTVTANATTSPDGTVTADRITAATGGTNGMARQARTLVASTAYTGSVFVKAATSTQTRILLRDTSAGTNFADATLTWASGIPTVAGGSTGTWTVTSVGNGWYRVTGTGSTGATASPLVTFSLFPDTSAGTNAIFAWGAQVEAGSFATSYIPTVASTVTRSADVAVMLGDNFKSWYNQNAGTFVVGADTVNVSSSKVFFAASDGSANNEHMGFVAANASIQLQDVAGGVSQASLLVATANANVMFSASYAYEANNFAACGNGGTVQTDTSGTLPVVDRLSIGVRGNNTLQINGHIRSIGYYNTRQPNATLQTLTNPSTTPSLALNFISDTYTVGA